MGLYGMSRFDRADIKNTPHTVSIEKKTALFIRQAKLLEEPLLCQSFYSQSEKSFQSNPVNTLFWKHSHNRELKPA
jgi:hypothetical protein